MKLLRYLFVGLLISGIVWGVQHQDQLKGAVNTTALMKQFNPLQQAAFGNHQHTSTRALANHALYYTPETNPERVDVPLINKIESGHIDAAFYSFTDRRTAEALVAAANRGVKVRIYRDQQQFEEEHSRNSSVTDMFAGNQNVQIRVKGSHDLMHLKAWATEGLLRDGSSNVSAAAKHQDNSVILSSNNEEITAFEDKFESMWDRSDNVVIQ